MAQHRDSRTGRMVDDEESSAPAQPSFSLFDPRTWMSGLQSGVSNFFGSLFNFGNIFTIGLLAFGAYFLARTEWGQDLIKGLAGMLPADWQVGLGEMLKKIGLNIPGLGLDAITTADQFRSLTLNAQDPRQNRLPQNIVDVIAPAGDNATFNRNKAIITGTGADLTAGVSDRLIFGLMFKTNPPAAGSTAATYTPNTEGRVLLRNLLNALPAATQAAPAAAPAARGTATGTSAPAAGSATTAPATTNTAPDATTASILNAVRSIAADPAKVNMLLADSETRGLMLSAITRFSPVPLNAQALDRFITSVGMTEAGQPTQAFTKFIGDALNPSTQGGVGGALVTFLTSPEVATNPRAAAPAWQALAQSIPAASITDPSQRQVIELLQHNAEPTLTLVRTLGTEKAQQFMTLLNAPADTPAAQAQKTQAIAGFVLAEPAFKTFADTPGLVNSLPAGDLRSGLKTLHDMSAQATSAARDMSTHGVNPVALADSFKAHDNSGAEVQNAQHQTLYTLQPLFSPEGRAAIRSAGVHNVATLAHDQMPILTERNLNTLLAFCDNIGGNNANKGQNAGRTSNVMTAIQEMMLNNNPEPFKHLTADELSGFFGDAANHAAFDRLMANLEVPAGTPAAQQLSILKRAWSSDWNGMFGTTHESVGNVLATRDGAQFVLDELNKGASQARETLAWATIPVVRNNSDVLSLLASAFPARPAAPQRPAH